MVSLPSKAARIALLALACTLPMIASAQWIWVEKDGRKVFSDRAPTPDVPAERILKSPRGAALPAAAAPVAGTPADTGAEKTAAIPKPAGKDKALEDRKKQIAAEAADKKKAEEANVIALRNENCSRARTAKVSYETGARVSRVNAQGEREYLSDDERAAELKRLQQVIQRDCGQ